jgi:D-amino-acid dehydrogenase
MTPPRHVAVVGAGVVGLSTAWFLQERGVQVTVLDRAHAGAGASWGNAGWLTPELTTPLPHPSVLSYGVRALLAPSSPVYVPPTANLRLLRFLTGFARHSTHRRWARAMHDFAPMNRRALAAFEHLTHGGVGEPVHDAEPFLAAYRTVAERDAMLTELREVEAAGQDVKVEVLSHDELRRSAPALSPEVTAAVRLHGQRYIHPPRFVRSLADSVTDRLGTVVDGAEVRDVEPHGNGVTLRDETGVERDFDAVVMANGAWLSPLVGRFGVRRLVQAGRGYSFSVAGADLPDGPVYFPTQRVACTPLDSRTGRRLRVAGMMEFRPPDAGLDPRRVRAITDAVRPLLSGVDLDDRQDEWVGARPCTADGLPLIGATKSSRVFVAGGHGMWGVAWGPLTGQLLAEQITTGETPAPLAPFDPLR